MRSSTVLDWAKASGYRTGDNPVDGLTTVLAKTRPAAKHHAALPFAQVPAFLQALRAAEAGDSAKLAFEFRVLTAARTSEVLGARWDEIDRGAKTWDPCRAHEGRAVSIVCPCPHSASSCSSARRQSRTAGSFVFPGRSPKAPLSNMVFLMLLRRLKAGDITTHGFRSAFRDWTAERTNFPRGRAKPRSRHVLKDKTEAAYFRSDLFDRRRKLMDTWAKFATAKPADVVSIGARRPANGLNGIRRTSRNTVSVWPRSHGSGLRVFNVAARPAFSACCSAAIWEPTVPASSPQWLGSRRISSRRSRPRLPVPAPWTGAYSLHASAPSGNSFSSARASRHVG